MVHTWYKGKNPNYLSNKNDNLVISIQIDIVIILTVIQFSSSKKNTIDKCGTYLTLNFK